MTKSTFFHLILLGFSLILSCSGCGKKLPYPVMKIEGTLLYQGKPLENTSLTFTPEEGRSSSAISTSGGKFVTIYSPRIQGVQKGTSVLTLNCMGTDGKDPGEKIYSKTEKEIHKKYGFGTKGFPLEITTNNRNLIIDLP